MRAIWVVLILVLLLAFVLAPLAYFISQSQTESSEVFFGLTFGMNTASEAKLLIDKVKDYTNLFVVDSFPLTNGSDVQELTEICDYAAAANLHFIVYVFSFQDNNATQGWLDMAKHAWGDKFLGVYLRDEPGGRQIDLAEVVKNATYYSQAANEFVQTVSSTYSIEFLHRKDVPIFTSDFALYWFDYLAGYDCIFVELVGNSYTDKVRQIDLCRGAADVQGKDWGAIITYVENEPPYLENGTVMLQDMLAAYNAGAEYIVVFNYPVYPATNPYGILTEGQFDAMESFWSQIHSSQRETFGIQGAETAFVLPKDYGWGFRTATDKIWGLWGPDSISSVIWTKTNQLLQTYGLRLDLIYNDTSFNFEGKYSKIYYLND